MKSQKSFTLVEVLVGTFLISVVFGGIFGAYQLGLKVISQSERKITAASIANQQIEKIRNLSYQDIGTKGASLPFVQGVLDSATTTVKNNIAYGVETQVKYIVDEADGTGLADSCNWDYKRAQVAVSWSGRFLGQVALATDIAPKDKIEEIQTCQTQPGGILAVAVFDAYGQMVESPLIEIFNPQTPQRIDFATPADGTHDFALATSTYRAVVSKTGYSQDRTYGSDEIATPEKPHPLVLQGQIISISFSIDRISSMNVEVRGSRGAGYPVIHDITFNLKGTKIIGQDAQENPVLKYSQNQTTNGAGFINISNLEWDAYYFSILTPDLDLVGIEAPPGTTSTQPVMLPPNASQQVRLILEAENSLLVKVENLETSEPVFSASVRASNASLSYDKTQYTDQAGQTYFIPLSQASYDLEIQAAGYLATSSAVSVSGDATTTIKLQQVE